MMNNESLIKIIDLMNSQLGKRKIKSVINHINSNIVICTSNDVNLTQKSEIKGEWAFLIDGCAWRISKNNGYVIGSGDDCDSIKIGLERLIDREIQNFQFTSDFLDFQIEFSDGYRLNTFFHQLSEDIWTIHMPNLEKLRLRGSSSDDIRNTRQIAKEFAFSQESTPMDVNFEKYIIEDIYLNNKKELKILLENKNYIDIMNNAWRIETKDENSFGCFCQNNCDLEDINHLFIGSQLKQINIKEPLTDASFLIGTNYILKIFAFNRSIHQWEIGRRGFRANIHIQDLRYSV